MLRLLDVTNLTVAHFRLSCPQSVSNYHVKAQPDAGLGEQNLDLVTNNGDLETATPGASTSTPSSLRARVL